MYFEIATTLAIVIGIFFANFFHPGTGVDMHTLAKNDISKYVQTEQQVAKGNHLDFVINIVPTNVLDSMAKGDLLPTIFFSVLLGLGVAAMGEKGKPVLDFFKSFSGAIFHVVRMVLRVAPFGVFGLIGVTVSKFGVSSLLPLGKLILTAYGAYIVFAVVCFGIVAKLVNVNFIEFVKLLRAELLLVFSTASSESVLPQLMEKLENYGCPKSIVSFVVPIGYSFNTDGSCLYMSLASIFIAQLYGIPMTLGQQIILVLILMVNMDIVNRVQKHPLPGETIRALNTEYIPGGKGANQAVASSLSGADVTFIGALGNDSFASQLKDSLKRYGVKTDKMMETSSSSGIAFITLDQCGENSIVLYEGSNAELSIHHIKTILSSIEEADAVLLQNEIPWETTEFVIREANRAGTKLFFNPAPALTIPSDLLSFIDVLILNETEVETVTGIRINEASEMEKAVQLLMNSGVKKVILTLGERGALYQSDQQRLMMPAFNVNVVDTTAAGDTFIGAFSVAFCSNFSIEQSLRFASAAAAICVSKKGAQLSIPTRDEILSFLNDNIGSNRM